ncbi:hypothetical protein BKA93DRAFT_743390, partial [Sparassis latifolia]
AEDCGELQQDEDFWFADGSIVLIAEHITFRVHQGVLFRHSNVFRDLFTVPQPESDFGCPVVHLHDSLVDIQYLLHIRRHFVRHEPMLEFSEVEALARLAHKYRLDKLRVDTLERLKAVFTDDFTIYITQDELPLLIRP